MKKLFYSKIPIVIIINFIFIFFLQSTTYNNIVNAQTVENEIIENNVEKAIAGIAEISKTMKNTSELITNYIETKKGDHDKGSTTLKEQLKLAQEKFKQAELESYGSSNKLKIDVGLPPIDFSKILKESQTLIEVEYQSAYSVVLRADEERFLLLNRTLVPFWYAIDIVKKYGYQLKEITESGTGTPGNPTRFYAILEK